MGDQGKRSDGAGYQAGDLFGPQQSDAFGDQFAEDNGQQGNDNEDQRCGDIGGIVPEVGYFFQVGLKVCAKFFSDIITGEDGDTRVMPIWAVERKSSGCSDSSRAERAFSSPLSASVSRRLLRADTRAISAMTNNPFRMIRKIRMTISSMGGGIGL
jgi:hypothetical protein